MINRPNINKIKNVYEKVSVYNLLMEEMGLLLDENTQFDKLPIIQKKRLIEKQSSCIMPEYIRECMSGNLAKVRTSGSTGQYLEIYWEGTDYIKSMVELWMLRVKFYGIYPHNRLCYFFTEGELGDKYIEEKTQFGICKSLLNESSLDYVYQLIMEWEPEWMILQPSTAVILCEYIKRIGLRVPESIRYIEFTGELLADEVRKLAKEVFDCAIADQYGCNEVNSIAFECPNGNKHILSSNVFIEIVDEDDNLISDSSDLSNENNSEGRIIVTSLQNKAMPFIRYDIGDRGRIKSNNGCKCGCKGKIMELYTGRNNDYVIFEDGEYTSSYLFVKIFDKVNMQLDGAIVQFYVEQMAYDEFNIMLCIDDEINENEVVEVFYDCIEDEHLTNAKFSFEFSERLFEVRGSGKHMYFKNSIE